MLPHRTNKRELRWASSESLEVLHRHQEQQQEDDDEAPEGWFHEDEDENEEEGDPADNPGNHNHIDHLLDEHHVAGQGTIESLRVITGNDGGGVAAGEQAQNPHSIALNQQSLSESDSAFPLTTSGAPLSSLHLRDSNRCSSSTSSSFSNDISGCEIDDTALAMFSCAEGEEIIVLEELQGDRRSLRLVMEETHEVPMEHRNDDDQGEQRAPHHADDPTGRLCAEELQLEEGTTMEDVEQTEQKHIVEMEGSSPPLSNDLFARQDSQRSENEPCEVRPEAGVVLPVKDEDLEKEGTTATCIVNHEAVSLPLMMPDTDIARAATSIKQEQEEDGNNSPTHHTTKEKFSPLPPLLSCDPWRKLPGDPEIQWPFPTFTLTSDEFVSQLLERPIRPSSSSSSLAVPATAGSTMKTQGAHENEETTIGGTPPSVVASSMRLWDTFLRVQSMSLFPSTPQPYERISWTTTDTALADEASASLPAADDSVKLSVTERRKKGESAPLLTTTKVEGNQNSHTKARKRRREDSPSSSAPSEDANTKTVGNVSSAMSFRSVSRRVQQLHEIFHVPERRHCDEVEGNATRSGDKLSPTTRSATLDDDPQHKAVRDQLWQYVKGSGRVRKNHVMVFSVLSEALTKLRE